MLCVIIQNKKEHKMNNFTHDVQTQRELVAKLQENLDVNNPLLLQDYHFQKDLLNLYQKVVCLVEDESLEEASAIALVVSNSEEFLENNQNKFFSSPWEYAKHTTFLAVCEYFVMTWS